jgi:uncharacterized protein YerC
VKKKKGDKMAQISKRPISKEISTKIWELFLDCFYDLGDKNEIKDFLDDFLTSTEVVMVIKRIAVVVLLARGYDPESIKDILKVSNSMISSSKARMRVMNEATRKKIDKIVAKRKIKDFFIKIESILDIIPPKGGDWSEWRRERRKKEMSLQDPF